MILKNKFFFLIAVICCSLFLFTFYNKAFATEFTLTSGTSSQDDTTLNNQVIYGSNQYIVPSGNFIKKIGFNFTSTTGPGTLQIGIYLGHGPDATVGDLQYLSPAYTVSSGFHNYTVSLVAPNSGNHLRIAFLLKNSTNTPIGIRDVVCANCGFGTGNMTFPRTWLPVAGAVNIRTYNTLTYVNDTFIQLNSTSGPLGSKVLVTGSKFVNNGNVNIFYDGNLVGQTGYLGTGWTKTIIIPDSKLGNHVIQAKDGQNSPTINYTVVSGSLILNSTNGNVGKTIATSGIGFINTASGCTISCNLLAFNYGTPYKSGGNIATSPTPAITNSTGGFNNINIVIPSSTAGKHVVNVTDSWLNNGSSTYNVTASLTANGVSSNTPGSAMNLIGNGFAASKTMSFKFNGVIISPSFGGPTISNTTGSFGTQSYNIPNIASGSYIVNATDGSHSALATILVTNAQPNFIISPIKGANGTIVNMTGNLFHASSLMTFKFDSTILNTVPTPVTTNSTGGFKNIQFQVNSPTLGLHNVTAIDASNLSQFQQFQVGFPPITNIINGTLSSNTASITSFVSFPPPPTKLTVTLEQLYVNNVLVSSKTLNIVLNANVATKLPVLSNALTTTSNVYMNVTVTDGTNTIVSKSNTLLFLLGPDPVTDLRYTNITVSTIDLIWSQPNLHGQSLKGYQINYTTPHGFPLTVLLNNTGTPTTTYKVSGLTNRTDYSFRIGIWAGSFKNMQGNILDITTPGWLNQTIKSGSVSLNFTNTVTVPIKFQRTDLNNTSTILKVIYPSYFNLNCTFVYELELINKTYTNLPSSAFSPGIVSSSFQFNGMNTEIIDVLCIDKNTKTTGRYLLTQTGNFVLKQEILDFKAGKYGTSGYFGIIDIVSLFVLIFAMVGLNRVNETVGAIFSLIIIFGFGYFGLIDPPTIIISGIAMVVLLVVTSTKKLAYS